MDRQINYRPFSPEDGAALVRLGKEALRAGRNVKQRADHAAALHRRNAAMPAGS